MSQSYPTYKEKDTGGTGPSSNDGDGGIPDQNYGHQLGSDDPLWPHYLEEAEKYDYMMVQKWDKKMETLLLFATLFSAIITAFVIESSQNLQPDNAAITAAGIMEIVEILRNRTMNNEREFGIPTPSNSFQPGASAFIVNFAWFISLCLSITVALLAGLVKQWCNRLLWDRTAPPCNQARIRQARLNKLVHLRTELVISALPVIMDGALGLFLLGLLVFLQDLSNLIFLAALGVTLLTATFYFGTTLAPFFVSFCPYETAISSRKTWGFFYQLCLATGIWIIKNFRDLNDEIEADLTNYMSPCEKKEIEMASNTDPDDLTGDALRWIILHSQKPEPRELAIRAIATLKSKDALKRLVSDPPGILPQVIQSFTSCFVANGLEQGTISFAFTGSNTTDLATLHGRALTVLVTQVLLEGSPMEYQVQAPYLHSDVEAKYTHSKWVIDSRTKEAVQTRFEYLTKNGSVETRTWALVGRSTWYDFIGIDASLRFNQGEAICELTRSLVLSLPPILRKEVLRTLTGELSYWAPNVSTKHRKDILCDLINLVSSSTPPAFEQPQLACALVALALNLNHRASYPLLPAYPNYRLGFLPMERQGNKLAENLINHYASNSEDLARDEQSLLLFALTGLMEYYEHFDFDDDAHENMAKIAARFQAFDSLGKLHSIKIPINIDGVRSPEMVHIIDLRAYFISILVTYLKLPRTPHHSQNAMDKVLARLLKAVNPKRQSCELEEYGSQIIPPVTQILVQTTDLELQTQCLSTIISYWDSGPPLLYSRMQLSYKVLPKLLQIIKDKDQEIPPNSTLKPNISLIFQKVGEQTSNFTKNDNEGLLSCMDTAVHDDLLEVLVDVVHVRDKIVPPRPQDGSSEVESGLVVENPLLQRVRGYLKDGGQAPKRGSGELLLKKMVEVYRENQLAAEVAQRWKSYRKSRDSTQVASITESA